jgi:hypothetical protein
MTLADYITENLQRPFAWGSFDCALFAAGWVEHKTGRNPLEGIPAWSNKREAIKTIRAVGGLAAALDARFERINPHLATDGMLAMRKGAVMLFSGSRIVGPGWNGLVFVSRMEAEAAWRI